jgi:hypothetical protein
MQKEKSHGVVDTWIGVENDLDFVHIENFSLPYRITRS